MHAHSAASTPLANVRSEHSPLPPRRPSKSTFEGIDFYTSITRARFEELCQDLFWSTIEPVEKELKDSKIDKSSSAALPVFSHPEGRQ